MNIWVFESTCFTITCIINFVILLNTLFPQNQFSMSGKRVRMQISLLGKRRIEKWNREGGWKYIFFSIIKIVFFLRPRPPFAPPPDLLIQQANFGKPLKGLLENACLGKFKSCRTWKIHGKSNNAQKLTNFVQLKKGGAPPPDCPATGNNNNNYKNVDNNNTHSNKTKTLLL